MKRQLSTITENLEENMNREKLLSIAERNMRKAKRALETNRNRSGITATEIENLENNVEYATIVHDLISKAVHEE